MGTAAALIGWARDELGTVEFPASSNKVHYWPDCGLPGFQGQPWCAAFVLAGLLRVGVGPTTRSVYVPEIEVDYQKARRWYPIEHAQPGDQVCYAIGAGHTGIVLSVDPKTMTLTAIEGNTSSGSAGSQDNGGGVYQRTRSWSLVHGVGRPAFDPAPQPAPPVVTPFPEDHMHRIDFAVPGLDNTGHGSTTFDGGTYPNVPADTVISVRANTAGYAPVPTSPGDEDYGGHARVQWVGAPNAPAFSARVWVTG